MLAHFLTYPSKYSGTYLWKVDAAICITKHGNFLIQIGSHFVFLELSFFTFNCSHISLFLMKSDSLLLRSTL